MGLRLVGRLSLFCLASAGATACGPGDHGPNPEGDGLAELGRLDVLPSPSEAFASLPTTDREHGTPGRLLLRDRIALGLGEGYAQTVNLRAQQYAADEVCDYIIGSFVFNEVMTTTDAVAVTLGPDDTVFITTAGVGRGEVVIRGTVTVSDPSACPDLTPSTEQPFELRVDTSVMETPPGVAFEVVAPCADSSTKYIQSGAQFGARAVPLDDAGKAFEFANASSAAQVPLRITADAQTVISIGALSVGIGDLVIEGDPGPVTIEAQTGATAEFELLEAASVTSAELFFGLGGGTPQVLNDGGVYDGAAGSADFIFALSAVTYAGATPLCTTGRVDDFRMSAPPGSACSVPIEGGQHLQKFFPGEIYGARVGVDVRVDASGQCDFAVDAPEFNAGKGWSAALSVTIENAGDLLDTGRE